MGKEKQMETRISPSGYRYYVPIKQKSNIQMPKKSWKNRLKQVLPFLGTVLKHFPHFLMRGVALMIMTPVVILLFILNLFKSLISMALVWIIFKGILVFVALIISAFLENILSHGNFEKFQGFLFPGQPITYWWEIVFIIVFGILMAYTLTFKPEELD